MKSETKLLDVVALIEDMPHLGLLRGQVGTVVESLGPETFEVEFADDSGRAYAMTPLHSSQIIVLHYRPQVAA
jgi:hypothetical protein